MATENMQTKSRAPAEQRRNAAAGPATQSMPAAGLAVFADHSAHTARQLKLGAIMNGGTQAMQLANRSAMLNNSASVAQNMAGRPPAAPPQQAPAPNATGLPDRLKAGVEALSGISLDRVKVHYNSAQPAQLNALAYAQGNAIHLGPGQEKHLPHEAWHVVQQAQGRVKPTLQMRGGVALNNDAGLEKEADVMGARALANPGPAQLVASRGTGIRTDAAQRMVMQMVWDAAAAEVFLNDNPPLNGETPKDWKTRVDPALAATECTSRADFGLLRTALDAHRNKVAQADAFVAAHVPARPQTFVQYLAAHAAPLAMAGYPAVIAATFFETAFDHYWTLHAFTQADANTFFAQTPPDNAPQTHAQYFHQHHDVLESDWHIDAALNYDAAAALFQVPMTVFRQTQAQSIAALTIYENALQVPLAHHLYLGGFNNGAPKGLHAYSHGGIGANTLLQTIGAPNGVHIVIWTNAQGIAAGRCKWSSMFPIDYPRGMSAWYILNNGNNGAYPVRDRPVTGLPAWQAIAVGSAGATRFPVEGSVNSTADLVGRSGKITSQNVNRQQQYTWSNAGTQYIIDN